MLNNPHQRSTLLMMRKHASNLFSPNKAFNQALQHDADGELDKLKKILDEASNEQNKKRLKELLSFSGTVVTPAGLTVKNTTLLGCAVGSGDSELIAMIKSYFPLFEGGEDEMEKQLARYRSFINEMQNQKPDDLTWLFDTIKKSSLQDVKAELATGNQYNPNYKSELRDAFNQFREMKLDSKKRVIESGMHCNYLNLLHAYELLDSEWTNLKVENSYDKHDLISLQIIGLIQLLELPAQERFIYARRQFAEATENKKVERSNNYKHASGSFPRFDDVVLRSRLGLGIDSFVSIYGLPRARTNGGVEADRRVCLQNLYQARIISLQNLCGNVENRNQIGLKK